MSYKKGNIYIISAVAAAAIIVIVALSGNFNFLNLSGEAEAYCKDSDNGKILTSRGTTSFGRTSRTDACYTKTKEFVASCSGEACYIREYFCERNRISMASSPCPQGCNNGACRASELMPAAPASEPASAQQPTQQSTPTPTPQPQPAPTPSTTPGLPATPDIYEFGFEDGTSGQFTNPSGGTPFITTTAWDLDTAAAALGTNSVRQLYPRSPQSGVDVGTAFAYQLPTPRKSLYVRFAYKQSNPFNFDGTKSNADQVKVLRFLGQGFSGTYGSLFIGIGQGANGQPTVGWDHLDKGPNWWGNRGANVNQPAPNLNNMLGQWHWYEVHIDISTNNVLKMQVWIDDVLYIDQTASLDNQGKSISILQFDGTINSMADATSTAWFDNIGISTQRMGVPKLS